MKEIRETKMVEQTTVRFVADDGKEFTTQEECKHHELQMKLEANKVEIDRLEHELLIGEFEIGFYDSDKTVCLYRLRNLDDLYSLSALLDKKEYCLDEDVLTFKDVLTFPTSITVYIENDGDYVFFPWRTETYIDELGKEKCKHFPRTAKETIDEYTEKYEQFLSVANKI